MKLSQSGTCAITGTTALYVEVAAAQEVDIAIPTNLCTYRSTYRHRITDIKLYGFVVSLTNQVIISLNQLETAFKCYLK